MSSEVQFVISDGHSSAETKKAQRRAVRSFITSQRYSKKRKQDIEAFQLQNKNKNKSLAPSIIDATSTQEPSEESVVAVYHAKITRSSTSNSLITKPADIVQIHPIPSDAQVYISLGPADYGRPLLQLPQRFPFAGSPFDDPFIRMPPELSPLMAKHMFYCASYCLLSI